MPDIEIPDPAEAHEKAADPFTRKIALCVAIFAVILAFAAAGGNNAGKDMLMEQMKASNKWNQYQAKAIRESNYFNEKERLEFELTRDDLSAAGRSRIEKSLLRIQAKLDEYKTEKAEIRKEAEDHERERDDNHKRDPYFDYAEVMLQVAIVLASVAMLSGRRWAFTASLILAILGAAFTLNGYCLLDGGKLLA